MSVLLNPHRFASLAVDGITVVGASSSKRASGVNSPIILTMPTVTAGDFGVIYYYSDAASTPTRPTLPAGWNAYGSPWPHTTASSRLMYTQLFWKKLVPGEPNPSLGVSSTSVLTARSATLLVFRGVNVGQTVPAVNVPTSIQAVRETALWAGSSGDRADDMAIYYNPLLPPSSIVVGVSKDPGSTGGVYSYNLSGTILSTWRSGFAAGGVDLRDLSVHTNVAAGWSGRVLVLTNDRETNTINYGFMSTAGVITTAGSTSVAFEPYGCCLYVSPITGKVFAFVSETGPAPENRVRQIELTISVDTVTGSQVRALDASIPSITEGLACYDAGSKLFLAVEDVALYAYNAEPDGGVSRTTIDTVGSRLAADIEGVTVVEPVGVHPGYVMCSSQGSGDFNIYNLEAPYAFVDTFSITAGAVEGSRLCDGIAAWRADFGADFPNGLFVAHDSLNTGGSNYKFCDLGAIIGNLSGTTTTAFDATPVNAAAVNTTNPAPSGITTTTNGAAIAVFAAQTDANVSAILAPAGYTSGSSEYGSHHNITSAYLTSAGTAGAKSPGAFTSTGATGVEEVVTVTIALRPV